MSQLSSKHTKDRVKVEVCFDRSLLHELQVREQSLEEINREVEKLDGILDRGMLGQDETKAKVAAKKAESADVQAEIDDLRAHVKKASVVLTFESIGRRAWRKLESEHPPTKEQMDLLKGTDMVARHNVDTFPVAAMLATCVEPPSFDEEDARVICEDFSEGAFDRVWSACLTANILGGRDPFEPEYATQRASAKKSKPRSA